MNGPGARGRAGGGGPTVRPSGAGGAGTLLGYHRPMHTIATVVALAVLAGPPGAPGRAGRCAGTLSGGVQARFDCTAVLGTQPGGGLAFVINVTGPVAGVPSVVPGGFQVPGPARRGTYTLGELGMGKASVAVEGGALYSASKTSSERGEVTLTFRSVKKSPSVAGAYDVRGTYRARLLPVGGAGTGEVVVEVEF